MADYNERENLFMELQSIENRGIMIFFEGDPCDSATAAERFVSGWRQSSPARIRCNRRKTR